MKYTRFLAILRISLPSLSSMLSAASLASLVSFFSLVSLSFLTACHKDPVQQPAKPLMDYTDLQDKEIFFNKWFVADLDKDSIRDISFNTLLVGDPIEKADYRQYYFVTSIYTDIPVNSREETVVLQKGSNISDSSFSGYNWYNAAGIVLAQKVLKENSDNHWEGNWIDKTHSYLALRINRRGRLYYGWVEISFDTVQEKITLHRAAICKEAGQPVKAGI